MCIFLVFSLIHSSDEAQPKPASAFSIFFLTLPEELRSPRQSAFSSLTTVCIELPRQSASVPPPRTAALLNKTEAKTVFRVENFSDSRPGGRQSLCGRGVFNNSLSPKWKGLVNIQHQIQDLAYMFPALLSGSSCRQIQA